MKRLLAGLGTLAVFLGTSSAVLAATPSMFQASGIVRNVSPAGSQNVHVNIAFKAGHVRIETQSKSTGTSIIMVDRGQDDVAMIDPAQKVVIHMRPSMLKAAGGAGSGALSSYQGMLDPAHFRTFILQHGGHEIGPGPGILGHRTTVYEADHKGSSMKVWLANDLSLPLKIQGKSASGDRFGIEITSLNLHPTFGAHYFDADPPGYTDIKAQTNR